MTRRQRAVLYIGAAALGAAHYWIFSYFLRLDAGVRRSLMTAGSLVFLIVGWVLVAFWASAPLPKRTRWRRAMRSGVVGVFAGIGGLLSEAGFETGTWAAIAAAFIAIILSWLPFGSE